MHTQSKTSMRGIWSQRKTLMLGCGEWDWQSWELMCVVPVHRYVPTHTRAPDVVRTWVTHSKFAPIENLKREAEELAIENTSVKEQNAELVQELADLK